MDWHSSTAVGAISESLKGYIGSKLFGDFLYFVIVPVFIYSSSQVFGGVGRRFSIIVCHFWYIG